MSVMNYRYQFNGVDNNCDANSSIRRPESLDYSKGRKFNLNENNLDENIGICNGELAINWISSGQQRDVDTDASESGRFATVWEDDRNKNGYYEIYARFFNTNSLAIMTEVKVNTVSAGRQRDPAIGIANNGRCVVVWEDDRDKNGYYEIFAQRLLNSGETTGNEIKVNVESSGNQRNPDIAVAADGTFVVTWEDDQDDNGYYEIYARMFSANGTPITGNIHVNTVSKGQQLKPRIEISDAHRFVVVWEDDRNKNGYYEIYSKRFSSTGASTGGEIKVNQISTGQQRNPDIGISANGQFVITWEDDRNKNGYYEIYARRFNANGTALGNEFKVNQVSSGQQRYPRVVSNNSFEFAISWQDDRDKNGYYEIFARPYNSNGSPRSNERKINPFSAGQQLKPDIGIDANAQLYIAWSDDRDGNDFYEIFEAITNSDGSRRTVPIDWDGDGVIERGVSLSINTGNDGDSLINTLRDYNDWRNLRLNF